MIALQTAMACHYWLFSYYKLLPLLPFCHDLLGKHRKQARAAEVCGYEVFGGREGGGEALVQQAVLVVGKWLWLKKKQSKGMWIKIILQSYAGFSALTLQDSFFNTDCCLEHTAVGILCGSPWSGLVVFHTLVTPNFLWLSFTQRSLEGLSGSCGLLLAVAGLNVREKKLLSHLLVTFGFTCGSPTGHPQMGV